MVDVLVLVALLARRVPMPWADLLVFSILAVGLLFPLVAWHLDGGVLSTDADVLALLLWSGLLFPLAFVAFPRASGVADRGGGDRRVDRGPAELPTPDQTSS